MSADHPTPLPPLPGLNDAENATLRSATRAMALLRRRTQRGFAEHGAVNRSQFEVLRALYLQPGGHRMFQLADALGLSRSTLTHHVTTLEKAGYVTREGGTPQQRAVEVEITDAGTEVVTQLRAQYADLVRRHFLSHFTPEQLDEVTKSFTAMAAGLQEEGTSDD